MAISKDSFRIKKGRNYVVKFNRYITPVNQVSELSSHTPPEINFFLGGSGKYMIDGCTFDFKSGDIFFIPPGASHTITHRNDPSDHINIWFVPDSLNLDMGKGTLSFNDIFARIKVDERIYFGCTHPAYEAIKRVVLELYSEIRHKRTGYVEMVKVKLMELTMLLVREFECTIGNVGISNNPRVEAIDNVLEYIQESVKKNFTLSELARIANMSPNHFGAVFKELNGITPWEYITSKKIELAQNLLKDKDMSVTDIVYECGYSNIANFNRAFKKCTNLTPSEYRKNINKKTPDENI